MRRRNNGDLTSQFYCVECGRQGIPLVRVGGRYREAGHLKKLYCIYCKKEVNHAEIRPIGKYKYEDFHKEFSLGRFVDGNRVPINELEKCDCSDCPFRVQGRCWNANHSYECEKRKGENNDESK